MLLGRVLMSMGDIEGGVDAFRKSFEMNPSNTSNSVSLAQALQIRGEEWDLRESIRVLQSVLKQQPQNNDALILFAEANMNLEQFEVALKAYELALKALPANDRRYDAIAQRINMMQGQQAATNPQTSGDAATAGAQISVQVSLDPELDVNIEQYSFVFLFARVDSMPMPVAVKRVPVSEFPMALTLSDQDMMLPELKLSQFDSVNLFARLSKDANAEFSQGEWQGQTSNVSPKAKKLINITINEGK